MRSATGVCVLLLFVCVPLFGANQGGVIAVPHPLFPPNNWWNTDISAAPVDPNSTAFINFIGATKGMHPDFGGNSDDPDFPVYGMPYIRVDGAQAKKIVDFVLYGDQSDGVGIPFYPVPDEAITMTGWVEGGAPGNVDQRDDSDRHILIVDETNNHLYELYNVWYNGTQWEAGSGAFFNMNTNNRRPEEWTSADAAGLAILPGLVRYDEVNAEGDIRHAFRVTVRATNGYFYPASHEAGDTAGALPMGARLRLKASKDISGYPADVRKIFQAMKTYGLIVADNGSDMYVSGNYDVRWNNDVLNPAFGQIKASDFEVIQLGWKPSHSIVITLPSAAGAGDPANFTVTVYDQNYNLATGYTGTIQFTSTDPAATLPPNYTFTAGDAGTHTFSGLILNTAGLQVVKATDVATPTITGTRSVVVGPPTPTAVEAEAVSSSLVGIEWSAPGMPPQFQILRKSSTSDYTVIGTTNLTGFNDNTVTPGAAYVYRVRAIDGASRPSPLSAPDAATAMLFTDDPAVAGTTTIKAVQINELRQAVNALRATAALSAVGFTDPVLGAGLSIKAAHVQELRDGLAAARSTLGLASLMFTDPTLFAGTTVAKAAHVQELRAGVK